MTWIQQRPKGPWHFAKPDQIYHYVPACGVEPTTEIHAAQDGAPPAPAARCGRCLEMLHRAGWIDIRKPHAPAQ